MCLDSVTWRESLIRFSAWVVLGARPDNALRLAHYLQNLAPPPFNAWARCGLDDDGFEALLDRGELETAAEMLIGPALRHAVSGRAGRGRKIARVWRDGDRAVSTAHDRDVPLALVKAWTGFMLERFDRSQSLAA
ncbi:hypothetical protein J4558_05695 [Leptolyngbya sp. 15MV]|nr:hypothetical protein J4558_05695 [Leptolyngbya sp. 15MV]